MLAAALDCKLGTTPFNIDQAFLTACLISTLGPTLMVVLSLLLRPRVNRIVNIVSPPSDLPGTGRRLRPAPSLSYAADRPAQL